MIYRVQKSRLRVRKERGKKKINKLSLLYAPSKLLPRRGGAARSVYSITSRTGGGRTTTHRRASARTRLEFLTHPSSLSRLCAIQIKMKKRKEAEETKLKKKKLDMGSRVERFKYYAS